MTRPESVFQRLRNPQVVVVLHQGAAKKTLPLFPEGMVALIWRCDFLIGISRLKQWPEGSPVPGIRRPK
jgi:hypothetical protein